MKDENNIQYYIYGLIDPRNNLIKYIGFTKNPKTRLYEHCSDSKRSKTKKSIWIKELLELKLKPELFILEEISYDERESKEKYWIKKYGKENLLNETEGGLGSLGLFPNEQTRKKIGENNKYWKGNEHSKESKEKMSKTRRKNDGYIGVIKTPYGKWQSRIAYKGKKIYIGTFDSELKAAEAYNEKAIEIFGKNALLNNL